MHIPRERLTVKGPTELSAKLPLAGLTSVVPELRSLQFGLFSTVALAPSWWVETTQVAGRKGLSLFPMCTDTVQVVDRASMLLLSDAANGRLITGAVVARRLVNKKRKVRIVVIETDLRPDGSSVTGADC